MNPYDLGWVKLHREYKGMAVFKDPKLWQFWTWCLMTAAYKPTSILVGYDAVLLQPGQLLSGKPGRRLASTETGLSDQTIKTFIKKLSSGPQPLIRENAKTNPACTIITIIDISIYENCTAEYNPQVTRNQPAGNPEPTRNQPGAENTPPPHTPHARAPARHNGKEINNLRNTHSPGHYDTAYHLSLETYAKERGVSAKDFNTQDGAKILATAVVNGDLEISDIPDLVRCGVADATVPNQGLRGIAKNYGKYLLKSKEITPKKEDLPFVTFVCKKCGHVYRQYWSLPDDPMPIQCQSRRREICRGVMMPHIASIRASPGDNESPSDLICIA